MIIWPIFLFMIAFGACAGSFINVVVIRIPRGMSVVWPASHDPATGTRLKWWENIPIISYLLLRGRSRYTGERIPLQYFLMEIGTAALFAGLYLLFYVSGLRDDWARWTVLSNYRYLSDATWADGDFNGDGWVDQADVQILLDNCATEAMPDTLANQLQAVMTPEPGSLALFGACLASACLRRRRR